MALSSPHHPAFRKQILPDFSEQPSEGLGKCSFSAARSAVSTVASVAQDSELAKRMRGSAPEL